MRSILVPATSTCTIKAANDIISSQAQHNRRLIHPHYGPAVFRCFDFAQLHVAVGPEAVLIWIMAAIPPLTLCDSNQTEAELFRTESITCRNCKSRLLRCLLLLPGILFWASVSVDPADLRRHARSGRRQDLRDGQSVQPAPPGCRQFDCRLSCDHQPVVDRLDTGDRPGGICDGLALLP